MVGQIAMRLVRVIVICGALAIPSGAAVTTVHKLRRDITEKDE